MAEKKKPGRKPTAAMTRVGPQYVGKTPAADAKREAALNTRLAKAGDLLPANVAYEQEAMFVKAEGHLHRGALEWLELGRCLVLIKEHEPHGTFMRFVEERLQMGARSARQAMQAAIRFLGPTLDSSKWQTSAVLGQAKLVELLVLDDDELDALSEGGTVADLTLDKVERMSVRELRKELRKSKEKAEVDGERAGKREQEISDLTAQLSEARRTLKLAKPDTVYPQMLIEMTALVIELRAGLRRCMEAVTQIAEYGERHQIDYRNDLTVRATEAADVLIELLSSLRVMGIDGPADHTVDVLGG